jgi:hypothetical protein
MKSTMRSLFPRSVHCDAGKPNDGFSTGFVGIDASTGDIISKRYDQ